MYMHRTAWLRPSSRASVIIMILYVVFIALFGYSNLVRSITPQFVPADIRAGACGSASTPDNCLHSCPASDPVSPITYDEGGNLVDHYVDRGSPLKTNWLEQNWCPNSNVVFTSDQDILLNQLCLVAASVLAITAYLTAQRSAAKTTKVFQK